MIQNIWNHIVNTFLYTKHFEIPFSGLEHNGVAHAVARAVYLLSGEQCPPVAYNKNYMEHLTGCAFISHFSFLFQTI